MVRRAAFIASCCVFLLLRAGEVQAATADGALGASSTGLVDLTLIKANMAQVSDIGSFSLGTYVVGSGDLTGAQNVCIYTTDPLADYEVTVLSGNGPGLGGELRMHDGLGNYLHYQAGWTDSSGSNFAGSTAQGGGGPFVGHNVTSALQFNANTVSATCGGGSNATFSINVPEAGANGLLAVPAGTYTDELSVVIDPG